MKRSMRKEYLAHVTSDGKKEELITHLNNVGELAFGYAKKFGCEDVALQIGQLHDLGKMTEKFQLVLERKMTHIDHAVVGSIYVTNNSINAGKAANDLICDAIYAHHTELPGGISFDPEEIYYKPENDEDCEITTQEGKVSAISSVEEYENILEFVKNNKIDTDVTNDTVNEILTSETDNIPLMLMQRMLLSCLVDADWTATAGFEDNEYLCKSRDIPLSAEVLIGKLNSFHDSIIKNSDKTGINDLRNLVYENASAAGKTLDIGFYSMTAPTGTGKTLALLKFALENAKKNNLSKIFIILPYLSIIEQNAQIYKDILGEDLVFEDDSRVELTEHTKYYQDRWSCPVIVTTSVNFFEMMFRAKAGKLRRLHQISNACIVFDESQTLPLGLTDASISALNYLTKYFNSTVLLSTATPIPYEFRRNIKFFPTEIMDNVEQLYEIYHDIKNTVVVFEENDKTYEDIYSLFKGEKQALWVLNTKKKALRLYEYIKDKTETPLFLLFSDMCPAHKRDVINNISKRLKNSAPVMVVSTQCIEAGVDFDFPCVAREYSPYMSFIQTLGRCNRNGKGKGQAVIFRTMDNDVYNFPSTEYKNMSDHTYNLVKKHNLDINPENISLMSEYYKDVFNGFETAKADKKELCDAINMVDYHEVENQYRFIENTNGYSVIVPYANHIDLYDEAIKILESNDYCLSKSLMKKLSKITVNVSLSQEKLKILEENASKLHMNHNGTLTPLDNWYILKNPIMYSDRGLNVERETIMP